MDSSQVDGRPAIVSKADGEWPTIRPIDFQHSGAGAIRNRPDRLEDGD